MRSKSFRAPKKPFYSIDWVSSLILPISWARISSFTQELYPVPKFLYTK